MPDKMLQGLSAAFAHVDPERVTMGQLYSLLYSMRAQQIQSNIEMEALRKEFADYKAETKDIKKAWEASQVLVKMLRGFAIIAVPATAILAITKAVLVKWGLWS